MTAFDPSKNYCADCGVQLEPLDNSLVCEVCNEKPDEADDEQETTEDESP